MSTISGLFAVEPDAVADPFGIYREFLSSPTPVFVEDIDAFVVADHASAVHVLRNAKIFSSRSTRGPKANSAITSARARFALQAPDLACRMNENMFLRPVLLNSDDPDHARRRRAVSKAFTPNRVRLLEPKIDAVVAELLDGFSGPIDFVAEFAMPLPVRVIAHALGVPEDQFLIFKHWSDALAGFVGRTDVTEDLVVAHLEASEQFGTYFRRALEASRRDRTDGLLDDLIRVADETGALTDEEILVMLMEFVLAGNETTTAHLAAFFVTLANDHDLADRLREDLGLLPAAIEESLRMDSPIQSFFRDVTEDTTLGGVHMPQGTSVLVLYAAANRDPKVYENPDQFRCPRDKEQPNLTFGIGPHFCLGATLARTESRLAFTQILTRYQSLELRSPTEALPRLPSFGMRAIRALPAFLE